MFLANHLEDDLQF